MNKKIKTILITVPPLFLIGTAVTVGVIMSRKNQPQPLTHTSTHQPPMVHLKPEPQQPPKTHPTPPSTTNPNQPVPNHPVPPSDNPEPQIPPAQPAPSEPQPNKQTPPTDEKPKNPPNESETPPAEKEPEPEKEPEQFDFAKVANAKFDEIVAALNQSAPQTQNLGDLNWQWQADIADRGDQEATNYYQNAVPNDRTITTPDGDVEVRYSMIAENEKQRIAYKIVLQATSKTNQVVKQSIQPKFFITWNLGQMLTPENYQTYFDDQQWVKTNWNNQNVILKNKIAMIVNKQTNDHPIFGAALGLEQQYFTISFTNGDSDYHSASFNGEINDTNRQAFKGAWENFLTDHPFFTSPKENVTNYTINDLWNETDQGENWINELLLSQTGFTSVADLRANFEFAFTNSKMTPENYFETQIKMTPLFTANNEPNNNEPIIITTPLTIKATKPSKIPAAKQWLADLKSEIEAFSENDTDPQFEDSSFQWRWLSGIFNEINLNASATVDNYRSRNFETITPRWNITNEKDNDIIKSYATVTLNVENQDVTTKILVLQTSVQNQFLTPENYQTHFNDRKWVRQNYNNNNIIDNDDNFTITKETAINDKFRQLLKVSRGYLKVINGSDTLVSPMFNDTIGETDEFKNLWNESISQYQVYKPTSTIENIAQVLTLTNEGKDFINDKIANLIKSNNESISDAKTRIVDELFDFQLVNVEEINGQIKAFISIAPRFDNELEGEPSNLTPINIDEPIIFTKDLGTPAPNPTTSPTESEMREKLLDGLSQIDAVSLGNEPAFTSTLKRRFTKIFATELQPIRQALPDAWFNDHNGQLILSVKNIQEFGRSQARVVLNTTLNVGNESVSLDKNVDINDISEFLTATTLIQKLADGDFVSQYFHANTTYMNTRNLTDFFTDTKAVTDNDSLDAAFVGAGGGEIKTLKFNDNEDAYQDYFKVKAIMPTTELDILASMVNTSTNRNFGLLNIRFIYQQPGRDKEVAAAVHKWTDFRTNLKNKWVSHFTNMRDDSVTGAFDPNDFLTTTPNSISTGKSKWDQLIEKVEIRYQREGQKPVSQLHPLEFDYDNDRYGIALIEFTRKRGDIYTGKIKILPPVFPRDNLQNYYQQRATLTIEAPFKLKKVAKVLTAQEKAEAARRKQEACMAEAAEKGLYGSAMKAYCGL